MHITIKDFKKYILFSLIFFWIILFSHLFYIYLEKQSKPIPVKWWILLEWVITKDIINPLPYIANNYYSKYVQSLLFKSCLNDLWNTELCNISTNDRKTFTVTLTWNNYWSDWRKITTDDIVFTYSQIIQNNSLNLENPIPNTIQKVEKIWFNKVKIIFKDTTVNNWSFFKFPILPKHILDWATKNYYVLNFTKNFINSTCIKIDPSSDFKTKIVLDYTKCKNFFINKYQFTLSNNIKWLEKYLTWSSQIDLYNGYENIDKKLFKKFDILLWNRYVLFRNTLRQTNNKIKTYISNLILSWLKQDIVISNRLIFNWYWLFLLPKIQLKNIGKLISEDVINKTKNDYKNKIIKIDDNTINYNSWDKKFFVQEKKDKIFVKWTLVSWYKKIWITSNSWNKYILRTYVPFSKKFKYVLSETFKNLKTGKNIYKIYWYTWTWENLIWKFTVFYKKIEYPTFKIWFPDFIVVYLNMWLNSLIWDKVVEIIKKVYPWKVIWKKVWIKEYKEILNSKNYDLVVSNINFEWKDISYLFLSKDSISNPSNFVNPNFSSLIKQDLLATIALKKKIFSQLDEIYKKNIPIVFIWNEKMWLFVRKKYNIPNINYSYFTNRKKMLKQFIITKIKKPRITLSSFKNFFNFIIWNIKNN